MKISDLLNQNKPSISFEFFPPKTEKGSHLLFKTIQELSPFNPTFVSVTYGAGGTTRELTHDLVSALQKQGNLNVMAHLTCIGATKSSIRDILTKYHNIGIRNIMALRGDLPQQSTIDPFPSDGFRYATDLVAFIKQEFPDFCVGVAGFPEGHPETPNRLQEMAYLKQKVDAGADFICTQLFFDNRDFFDFKERARLAGISCPILAGIMPIVSKSNYVRMAQLAAGVRYPAPLLKQLSEAANDDEVLDIGRAWAIAQVNELVAAGVGIHLYTLNKSLASQQVIQGSALGG